MDASSKSSYQEANAKYICTECLKTNPELAIQSFKFSVSIDSGEQLMLEHNSNNAEDVSNKIVEEITDKTGEK